MDAVYFLKYRTKFIRYYYDASQRPFVEIRGAIDNQLPPFDNPPYSEDGEPAFLNDWMDAQAAMKVLGLSCVSLLSESLKLYLHALRHRVIGYAFADPKKAFKSGFLAAHLEALAHILQTDWSDCGVDLGVIEQVVLARNRGQHGEDFGSFNVTHDDEMLRKHPSPFFANDDERRVWSADGESPSSFLAPTIDVTREKLFAAMEEIEKLADYIEGRLDRVTQWRLGSGSRSEHPHSLRTRQIDSRLLRPRLGCGG